MTLLVVAHLPAKPDKVDELKTLLTGLLEPTRKEDGCISYVLYQNTKEPADLTFVEEWESAAHLDAHLNTEHLRDALAKFPNLLAGEAQILTYNKVG